jgi:hypothetical protein
VQVPRLRFSKEDDERMGSEQIAGLEVLRKRLAMAEAAIRREALETNTGLREARLEELLAELVEARGMLANAEIVAAVEDDLKKVSGAKP